MRLPKIAHRGVADRSRQRPAGPVRTVLPRLAVRPATVPGLVGFSTTVIATLILALAVLVPAPGPVRTEQAANVPVPAVPAGLPAGIEDLGSYVGQTSCDPVAKPGVRKLSALLVSTYPGTSAWSPRPCGLDGPGLQSEHYEGRALDWSVSVRNPLAGRRAAALLDWLLATDAAGHPYANARRLGIMYIIWNNRMWRAYRPSAGWLPYRDCAAHPERGYDTSCHRDHIHFSLTWAGALGRTSFWSHRVAAADYGPCRPADLNWAPPYSRPRPGPCHSYPGVRAASGVSSIGASLVAYSGATVGPGSTGPVVTAVQRALKVAADGGFGPVTSAAVSAFRVAHHLPAGTQVDQATWRALLAAYATPGRSGGSGGSNGSGGSSGAPVTSSPATAARPLAAYSGTVLRYGSRGAGVAAVQRALRVRPVSGWFGPITRAAVIRFQAAHGIRRTGNVGPLTWRALGG